MQLFPGQSAAFLATLLAFLAPLPASVSQPGERTEGRAVGTWETVEIELTASRSFANPYTDVSVWALLTGPGGSGFQSTKVWGFWDGGRTFRVRLVATVPGTWTWVTGASEADAGLNGKTGSFTARGWTEAELRANPNRRGFVRVSASRRAFSYADGTSFLMVGHTWWGASTSRVQLKGREPSPGEELTEQNWSFEGGIAELKKYGYNTLAFIAAHPNWEEDGQAVFLRDDKGVPLRNCKPKTGTNTCRDMRDESGNRPFLFPGRCAGKEQYCADFDRINPEYFKSLDRKFLHLHKSGFVAYLESLRRDQAVGWFTYHDWAKSFSRYLNYLQARYGTFNLIFSLAHIDYWGPPALTGEQWRPAFDAWYSTYGMMPFGQVVTTMAVGSSLKAFGHPPEVPWLQAHTVGNEPKDHSHLVNLAEMAAQNPPIPCFNNEPHYAGWNNRINAVNGELPAPNSDRDTYFVRAMAYGSVLSGALAGHIFGDGARWNNTVGEPADPEFPTPWECLGFTSHKQVRHFVKFVTSEGNRYQDLLPATTDLPHRASASAHPHGLDGWAHMMCTADRRFALLYFENGAIKQVLKNMRPKTSYRATWFDPILGRWSEAGESRLVADESGEISLPDFPGGWKTAHRDWGLKLIAR